MWAFLKDCITQVKSLVDQAVERLALTTSVSVDSGTSSSVSTVLRKVSVDWVKIKTRNIDAPDALKETVDQFIEYVVTTFRQHNVPVDNWTQSFCHFIHTDSTRTQYEQDVYSGPEDNSGEYTYIAWGDKKQGNTALKWIYHRWLFVFGQLY